MKRTKGGWLLEPGEPLPPLKPETCNKIAEILAGAVVTMIRDGKLKTKDGQIDWSSLPPAPPPRKPKKGQDFRVEVFIPDSPTEAEAPAAAVALDARQPAPARREPVLPPVLAPLRE